MTEWLCKKPVFRLVVLLLLFSGLQACGFHLRGSAAEQGSSMAKIPSLAISGNVGSFIARLKNELENSEVDVVPLNKADWLLTVYSSQRDRRVMSVDEDGKAQEYELRQRVDFSVRDIRHNVLKTKQQLSRSRDLLFDKTELLGKSYEESLLYKDIEQDMVNAIIWRLRALALDEAER